MKAYLDSVEAKTGKTWRDFKKLAGEKGLTKHADLMAWLKADFDLGHGHANAITQMVLHGDEPKASEEDVVAQYFTGAKAGWREAFDGLVATLNTFGPDVSTSTGKTYINLLRNGKKFGIVQVTGKRMDIGIKRKGAPAAGRFEESGAWNAMVTHRVQVEDASQIDAELVDWLRNAYEKA